jgi:hypothetical protein
VLPGLIRRLINPGPSQRVTVIAASGQSLMPRPRTLRVTADWRDVLVAAGSPIRTGSSGTASNSASRPPKPPAAHKSTRGLQPADVGGSPATSDGCALV